MNIAEITEQKVTDRANAALPAELSLHKIAFFHSKGNTRIVIQLDKVSDKYGSVNIRECEVFARGLKESLDELETTTGLNLNFSLEVSSAGAERELVSLADVRRFTALPLSVTFLSDKDKVLSEVLKAESVEGETIEFSFADCKHNRKKFSPRKLKVMPKVKVAWNNIKKVKLHLDV